MNTVPPTITPASESVRAFLSSRIEQRPNVLLPKLSAYATYVEACAAARTQALSLLEFDIELQRTFETRVVLIGTREAYAGLTIPANTGVPVALTPANVLLIGTSMSPTPAIDIEFLRNQLERRAPIGQYQILEGLQFGAPNTDLVVRHSLRPSKTEAVDYHVLKSSGFPLGYHDTSPTRKPWGSDYVLLRSPVANLKVDLLLTVRAKAPGSGKAAGRRPSTSRRSRPRRSLRATSLSVGAALVYQTGSGRLRFGSAVPQPASPTTLKSATGRRSVNSSTRTSESS
jgi:hypothetical protein